MKMNLFNVNDCLILSFKNLFGEFKCFFFYEMLVKLWSIVVVDDDVTFPYFYFANNNNKAVIILYCFLPQFLEDLLTALWNFQDL